MSTRTIQLIYSAYNDDYSSLEPSDITYRLTLTEDADFTELLKHFRRFLKALDIK
jgi:hypothetical protein